MTQMANVMKAQRKRFEGLGREIYLLISRFLNPLDIISLGQTCRSLSRLLSDRKVWVNCLHDMCIANRLFLPTFPISEMSIHQLQHAVTAPARMLSILTGPRKSNRDVIEPFQTCKLFFGKSSSLAGITLLPGGRFLVAGVGEDLGIWDLGNSYQVNLRPKPVVHFSNMALDKVLSVYPTSDGTTVRIACERISVARTLVHVTIFQSNMLSSGSSILGKTTLNDINVHALKDDLFISISDTGIINVWDFVNDLSSSWRSTNFELDGCKQIIIEKQTILVIGPNGVAGWITPRLYSKSQNQGIGIVPPDFTFPQTDVQLQDSTTTIRHAGNWYMGTPHALFYTVFSGVSSHSALSRFQIHLPDDYPAGKVTHCDSHRLMTICKAPTGNNGNQQDTYIHFGDHLICNDCIVIPSSQMNFLSVYVIPATDNGGSFPTLGGALDTAPIDTGFQEFQLLPTSDLIYDYSFDPASGRLCYLASDKGSITVRDYLRHPEARN